MRVRVLRTIYRVSRILHPAQGFAGLREIGGNRIARLAPLRALIARFAQAELPARPGSDVDDLESFIGMIGVAQDALAAAIGRDVPGIVFGNGANPARGPI